MGTHLTHSLLIQTASVALTMSVSTLFDNTTLSYKLKYAEIDRYHPSLLGA